MKLSFLNLSDPFLRDLWESLLFSSFYGSLVQGVCRSLKRLKMSSVEFY